MYELAEVKKLHTTPYHPETNGNCECFNATLINMLGTLPTHAKKNWQEWVATLAYTYNCTVSSVTGFSPYFFFMFGRTPKIPCNIEMGVTLVEQENMSYQNYVKKLQDRLKWAYQTAQENSQRESEHHKKYWQENKMYELETKWFSSGACKSTIWRSQNCWSMEDIPYLVLSQLAEQPVFQAQPVDAINNENIRVLHRNMLFPYNLSQIQTLWKQIMTSMLL